MTSSENKSVAVRKKPVTHFTHYTDSERCLEENIKNHIVCFYTTVYVCFGFFTMNDCQTGWENAAGESD